MGVEAIRAQGGLFFTAFGFIPVIGDIASTAWFVGWDLCDCATVGCNWVNLGGLTRMAGRAGSVLPLPFVAGVVRLGDEFVDVARGAGTPLHHIATNKGTWGNGIPESVVRIAHASARLRL